MRSLNDRPCACFNVVFEEENDFEIIFSEKETCICIDFGELTEISEYEIYDGDYIVSPKTTDQILETNEKAMRDDVTVLAVPYVENDNPAGGLTVTIGM